MPTTKIVETALAFPFAIDDYGNVIYTTSQYEIWAGRVKSVVGTVLGERVMRPTYGTDMKRVFFNTRDAAEDTIRKEVSRVFASYLPLLTLSDVAIDFSEFNAEANVMITYSLPNLIEVQTSVGIVTIDGTRPAYEENA
jgi:phage baseplate assembly protein W